MAIEDSSTLQNDFKSSLILDKGTGNPTSARATDACVSDNEGKLITVTPGVARFGGARLTVNQATSIPANLGSTSSVNISGDEYEVTFVNFGDRLRWGDVSGGIDGNSYLCQVEIKRISGGDNFSLQINEVTGGSKDIVITDEYVRYDNFFDGTNGLGRKFFQLRNLNGAAVIRVRKPMLEDTTGESDETLLSPEIVSRDILSSPWHGAGADGAKWFNTNKDGSNIASAVLKGLLNEPVAATNQLLWNRDLTNAVWVKTNITSAKDQTGIDNIDNRASSALSTAANATCLQTITLAAATRTSSVFLKRIVGTGTIEITRNGGTSWTDVTSSINSSTYTRVSIKGTSVLNPEVGFRIVTSGDKIAYDWGQDEAGSKVTSPIPETTSAAVTRQANQLSYQTSGNISDTAGAISVKIESDDWANITGNIGSSTTGLAGSSSNSGVQALDGTNTVNGPTGTPTGQVQMATGWSGSTLKAAAKGVLGTSGSYDSSLNLTIIDIGIDGYISDLNIWTSALSDEDLKEAAGGTLSDMSAVGAGSSTVNTQAFARSETTAAGAGVFNVDSRALAISSLTSSGVGSTSIEGSSLASTLVSMPGQAINVINIKAALKSDLTADGIGSAVMVDANAIPTLQNITIDLST